MGIGYNEDNRGRKGMKDGMGLEYRFLDVIWLDNLANQFYCFVDHLEVIRNISPMWRLWCSAGIRAGYATVLILPGFDSLPALPFKILLSFAMLTAGVSHPLSKGAKLLGYFMALPSYWEEQPSVSIIFQELGHRCLDGVFLIGTFYQDLIFSVVLSSCCIAGCGLCSGLE